jgi:hypothetical protein
LSLDVSSTPQVNNALPRIPWVPHRKDLHPRFLFLHAQK